MISLSHWGMFETPEVSVFECRMQADWMRWAASVIARREVK